MTQRYEYWNFGDYWGLGYDSIVNWQPFDPPARPGYTLAYAGIGTYDVMLIDSNICGRDTAYITIEIVPQPVAQLAVSDDTICAGEPITFFNQSYQVANNFYWDFGNGYFNSGGANQNTTFNATGNYTTTLVANIAGGTASCFDTTEIDIHVLPSPVAAFDLSEDEACNSLTMAITDQSQDALIWEWDFGNGNTSAASNAPNQFYSGQGTYTIELKVEHANSCRDSITQDVVINESPLAAFTPMNFCQEAEAIFTDQSTHLLGDPIIHWNWDFGNGNTSTLQNPVNVYFNAQTYAIQLLVETAHCADTLDTTLTVPPKPIADFTPSDTAGCESLVVHFADSSSGATQYFWTFADTATSNLVQPRFTFSNPNLTDTAYTVELIVENNFGCSDTLTDQIEVFGNAIADFVHTAAPDCGPLTVDFFDASQGATQWFWDFGDSTTSSLQNPTHTFNNNTLFINNYVVELVVTSANGCTDTTSQTITVYPEPNFPFSTVPDSGCSPLEVSFPALVGAVQYQWDFGDETTASGQAPNHVFVNNSINNQIFTVELIATSVFGCSDTVSQDITVFNTAIAQITATPQQGCTPVSVQLTNTSWGADSYFWDFNDGTTSASGLANFSHTYANNQSNPEDYTIAFVAETVEGCNDTLTEAITVFPPVNAAFDSDTLGCSPLELTFISQSSGAAAYLWNFGNGSNAITTDPSATFVYNGTADTTYTVTLVATSVYNCSDTASQEILVYPEPEALFTVNPTLQTYSGTSVSINNLTNGQWNTTWDFGDGQSNNQTQINQYDYNGWGEYTITLFITNGLCSDSNSQVISILPPPPEVDFLGSGEGCAPLTVEFENQSVYTHSYLWEFGDGNISESEHPMYTYMLPGTYTVKMKAFGFNGQDSVIKYDSIVVHPSARAYFDFRPLMVQVPNQPVQFLNLSSDASSYQWSFGDGITSSEESPQHAYSEVGEFYVKLVASNVWGCADSFNSGIPVVAESGGQIDFPNVFTPSPSGPSGGYYGSYNLDNQIFYPISEGVEDYHLMIYNRWGELVFETFELKQGWDGYYRNELCQQDVYVFRAEITFSNGEDEVVVGDLTLLR